MCLKKRITLSSYLSSTLEYLALGMKKKIICKITVIFLNIKGIDFILSIKLFYIPVQITLLLRSSQMDPDDEKITTMYQYCADCILHEKCSICDTQSLTMLNTFSDIIYIIHIIVA